MKNLKIYICFLLIFSHLSVKADEGMWLPQLLNKLNESRMKSLGMKISAEDIYSINKGSLKDAIVSFGGFCTGEVISDQGLLLTNHHCGFGMIQQHSSIQNNYIRDGFWAMNRSQELPNAGLFATFIVRIDDVTVAVMKGVTKGMDEAARQSLIDKNIAEVRRNTKVGPAQETFIRGFFEANQYYMFTTETYRDVRLVGAPPSSIGNFGMDTDNWVWPRHTGDFAMFRIYASKNNMPAEYAADNVPYIPKRSLSISLSGIEAGDFTMVFGFPGRTNEYLHSDVVKNTMEVSDPVMINIRDKAMAVLMSYMRKDEAIKIQYASKYQRISNAWKKWQGEVLGLKRTKAVEKKQAYEADFQQRVDANPTFAEYRNLLNELKAAFAELQPYSVARDYYTEIVSKIELYSISMQLNSLLTAYDKDGVAGYEKRLGTLKPALEKYYKDYNAEVDMKVFEAMMRIYMEQNDQWRAPVVEDALAMVDMNYTVMAENIYQSSFASEKEVMDMLKQKPDSVVNLLRNHPTLNFFKGVLTHYQTNVQSPINPLQNKLNALQRTYMQAQLEVMTDKTFYPDANSTLRVTYGKVDGYQPRNGVKYEYYTTLDGVMEKYVPGDYEFDVPEKLRTLYANKDYGVYGNADGTMPVCFIGSNHTTGGNSGSPALDAYGNLIGLNFDRVWEGTMSDINYDATICRNIMVDARYILFIVDKYAGAKHLIDEMKIVYPKKGKKKKKK